MAHSRFHKRFFYFKFGDEKQAFVCKVQTKKFSNERNISIYCYFPFYETYIDKNTHSYVL